jgi:NADP-dependent aldehyde dehydrogenase
MLVGIGPVVVFGSSNFPFAYSTAGGDTASALAAGCTVVVKAHPAHPKTSELVAGAIQKAIQECQMPTHVFQHVHGQTFAIGQALVAHPNTKAVGFTGSLQGGRALFDTANQRAVPIPVFAEMGSINPVVLMPQKLANEVTLLAKQYAASITLGVGQFCTNPGLILGIKSNDLTQFMKLLGSEIEQIAPAKMLHAGIYQNYEAKKIVAIEQDHVELLGESVQANTGLLQGRPTVASVPASVFIDNPTLHQEVFGPYSLVVVCDDLPEMTKVIATLEGQLTATIMATEAEAQANWHLIQQLENCCGRLILNGVPTGVEVAFSMQHGGPYPASTDGRFGSVGPDAIKRFVRPVSYQGFPDVLLPAELKAQNPLNILRIVDGEWVR